MFGKRLHSREEPINRSGRMRALQGSLARPPPFWLSLPTAVSKQVGGRLEDAQCLTPNSGREKQRLEGVAENDDKWTRETAGRPVGGFSGASVI